MINPGGARNREFFNWGIQAGSGQLGVLMSNIDRGMPVVIGLSSCGNGCKSDHQVVAIGYQLGRYKGDMGAFIEDLTIFIYDPNKPTEIRKLKPSFTEGIFYCPEDNSCKWRTYFVDTKYTPSTPPVIANNPKELILTFVTGGDDLRGGNDNVNISVYVNEFTRTSSSSYRIYRDNLNNGKRWINNSTQSVSIPLADNYNRNYIVKVELCTRNFAGGIGGDNWNLDRFIMQNRINGTVTTIIDKSGSPLFRFTGDNKTLIINK